MTRWFAPGDPNPLIPITGKRKGTKKKKKGEGSICFGITITEITTVPFASFTRRRPDTYMKGGYPMATFIILLRFTPQGIGNIKESPKRLDAAKQAFRAMGAELKQWYLVQGQYDAVVIAEGPDEETAMKLALLIGSQGNIRTETLRAFTEDEYRKIIAALP
jgi:uncharacterized protein with GYD domain